MKYEVSYKCVRGFPGDVFYEFPILKIRYRPIGTLIWKNKNQPVDLLAKDLGYCDYNSSLPLSTYGKSTRVKYFDRVLREKFGGNMDSYVKKVAYTEILTDKNLSKHDLWVDTTIKGWLNNKWEYLEVEIPD